MSAVVGEVQICGILGEYYNTAAEAAMEAMKGKLATRYYALAEECMDEGE